MTTPAAEKLYLAKHKLEMEGKGWAVHNPNNLPVAELPIIYGFNNGGGSAMLLAEDGTYLGGHLCTSEGYMPHDLGILEGTAPRRHEGFRKHYPDGYRMAFVSAEEGRNNAGLEAAYEKNQQAAKKE